MANGGRARAFVWLVWTAAFLGGAFNHLRDLLAGGWLPYRQAPLPFNLFWSALLPVDLAVAALLWWRPRRGVALGVAVMLVDVAVNTEVARRAGVPMHRMVQLQILFLGFVLGSAPLMWRRGR